MDIRVKQGVVHYRVVHPEGKRNLLLLHGWGHSGAVWEQWAERLPEAWRVVLPDLPAFGRSPALTGKLRLEEYARAMAEVMSSLGAATYALMGHSFGAQIGVKMALMDPRKVQKLVLVAPAIVRRTGFSTLPYRLLSSSARFKRWLPKTWQYRITDGLDYSQASEVQKQVFREVLAADVAGLAPEVSQPVLIVWGEKDSEVMGSGKRVIGLFPDARLKMLYDTGHQIHLERPRELKQEVRRFLQ